MAKILFISDLNFGCSSVLPVTDEHRLLTLEKICSIGVHHDLLLIGGNLFGTNNVADTTISKISEQIELLGKENTEVCITAGNNELENCKKIEKSGLIILEHETAYKSKSGLTIFGIQMESDQDLSLINPPRTDTPVIALINTAASIKTGLKEIISAKNSSGIAFFAVGGNRDFKILRVSGKPAGAQCGSSEPLDRSCKGARYAVSFEINGQTPEKVSRYQVNTLEYNEYRIDTSIYQNEQQLSEKIKELGARNLMAKIEFTGPNLWKTCTISDSASLFFNLETDCKYNTDIDSLIHQFRDEISIRGLFYRELELRLANSSEINGIDTTFLNALLNKMNSTEELCEEDICDLYNV